MSEHNHSHVPKSSFGLIFAIILNSIIVLAKIIGGIIANSLTLISDGMHDLTDVLSLILTWIGEKLGLKKGDEKHSFDYKRAEVIIAFVNSLALVIVGFFILYEAIHRFYEQSLAINGSLMLIIAVIGFFGNLFSVFFLHGDKDDNLNKKAAYLHILFDVIASLIVLISGIIIYYTHWYIVDLIASIIISVFVIKGGWGILKNSLHILMQGTPANIDVSQLIEGLKQINGIKEIHELHIWNIDSNDIFFSAHIVVEKGINNDELIKKVNKYLHDNYKIHHTNLQLETNKCN